MISLKTQLKLLFITYTHSNGGGAENVLTTLVNHLDASRYKIDIIEVEYFGVKKEPLNPEITLLKSFSRADGSRNNMTIHHILYEYPEIIKPLFRLYDYDAVISWNYQLPSFCLRAFRNEVKIAWFHGAIYDFLPDAPDAKPEKYKILQQMAWDTADRIVTISNGSIQSLKDIFPHFMSKTEIIHNGCDTEKIKKLSLPNISYDTIKTDNIIIAAGRLDKNKNFELIIRAVSNVIHSGIDCFLILIGQGELLHELENIVEKENIKEYVLFAGYQQNPYPYFRCAKIVCLSSFAEGFPTVIVESMVLGKPFVTTPVSGASDELAAGGRCGLVAGWNIEEYSGAIKRLLTDSILYETMSNNCIEKAREFSAEQTVKQFDTLLKNICHKRSIKTDEKENRFLNRTSAVCIYAYIFTLKGKHRVSPAFNRLKNYPSMINAVKLCGCLIFSILNCICMPFNFLLGIEQGVSKGANQRQI
jgi:glycosyltransferase involved in cell wall biosynthesis